MAPNVVWSAEAIRDLADAIADAGLGADAARLDDGIQAATASILAFPAIGRPGRIMGTREQLLQPLPFILIYRFDGQQLVLLRLYHTSRQWPPAKPKSPKPKA